MPQYHREGGHSLRPYHPALHSDLWRLRKDCKNCGENIELTCLPGRALVLGAAVVTIRIAAAAPVALAVVATPTLFEDAFSAFFTLAALPMLEFVVVVWAHGVVRLLRVPHSYRWRILVL